MFYVYTGIAQVKFKVRAKLKQSKQGLFREHFSKFVKAIMNAIHSGITMLQKSKSSLSLCVSVHRPS